jgi:hypothetical protein
MAGTNGRMERPESGMDIDSDQSVLAGITLDDSDCARLL